MLGGRNKGRQVVIGRIADGIAGAIEDVAQGVSEALFEPVIRLGVTGLARSGKTVFITSLVANLMDRARMPQLLAARDGAIRAAWLQPQPDDTVPRFDYEAHLAALTGPEPHWPESTRRVSELRLSLKVQPSGVFGALSGPRTVHLDIVDYPGEWLLDLALLDKSYAAWSAEVLERIAGRDEAAAYLAALATVDPAARFEEPEAKALAASFSDYLKAARVAGYSDCTPGRFLLPGDLEGSPALTFAPLSKPDRPERGALWREFERRYEAYKREVVRPFFRDHFAKIDRQVVLMDVLGAIHAGPRAMEDMRRAMAEILGAFRPGRNAWLTSLFGGRRVERILFAATKADHLHHSQHGRLAAILEAMLREAKDRADFAGARTAAMAIASLRATVEETAEHGGEVLDMVRGRLLSTGKTAAMYAGELPEDPGALIGPARAGAGDWLGRDYAVMAFAPGKLALKPGEGPPHIRLDRAAEFLIGDRLR
jgi:predicted YcjX-like family ATPase